jgi:hypothetical protein
LAQVDLIDLQSVRFLRDCEDEKIELRNCPPYIQEWIRRERAEGWRARRIAENSAIAEARTAMLWTDLRAEKAFSVGP